MTLLNIFFFTALILTGFAVGAILFDLDRAEKKAYKELALLESSACTGGSTSFVAAENINTYEGACWKLVPVVTPAFLTLSAEGEASNSSVLNSRETETSNESAAELNYDFALAGRPEKQRSRSKVMCATNQLNITDATSQNKKAAIRTECRQATHLAAG